MPVQIDIEDDASIEALRELVEKEYGRIDVLVNNAGEFALLPVVPVVLGAFLDLWFCLSGLAWASFTERPRNLGAQLDQQLYQGKLSMREMWNKSWDVNVTGTYVSNPFLERPRRSQARVEM